MFGLVNFEESNADINFDDYSSVNINEVDTFSNIVIFIRFADEPTYTAPHSFSYYLDLFNGVDKVSLRDYYLEVSYGQLDITSYIVSENLNIIYYTDTFNRDFFEPYDEFDNPNGYSEGQQSDREHALLKRAIDYVDANDLVPDTLELDANDDGDIDSITFMVSGEDNGWNTLLWPHKWELSTYYNYNDGEYEPNAPTINGKYAYTYTLELLGNSAGYYQAVDVGVLAHETFHLISAPDLYHYYDYDWIDSVGDWGLMDNVGEVPSHMLGYMKMEYGNWITSVDEITTSGTYTLYPLSESGDNLYRINTNYSNEFIYIEYRDNDGLYESTLPDSGLIVYRVDYDFYDDGNVDGYYDEDWNAVDEVFVFRPNMYDVTYPIEFPITDKTGVDDDGDVDFAALSQNNLFDEIGVGTNNVMFHSDGSEVNLTIYNVVEHDGYITFDVSLPISIDLNLDYQFSPTTELRLVELAGLEYDATIYNIPDGLEVYYTTDGTVPDDNSTPFMNGDGIPITSTNNTVKVVIINQNGTETYLEKTFTFTSNVESAHSPYGDDLDITWVLGSSTSEDMSFFFNNQFELELDYDYLYISDGVNETAYTGTDLSNTTLDFTSDLLIINFVTDAYVDDFYGFDCEITLESSMLSLSLNGLAHEEIDVFDAYTNPGVTVTNEYNLPYTIVQVGIVNPDVVGEYIVTFNLLNDAEEIVDSVVRTVDVIDDIAPEITLNGDEFVTVEVGDDYTDPGITINDNYYDITEYDVDGEYSTTKVGLYRISYSVTDLSGNKSVTLVRTISVVDSTPPEVSLRPGIDTIYVGDEWVDVGVNRNDAYDVRVTVDTDGVVDNTTAGTYTITYTVSDSSGNAIVIKRVVTVLEVTADEINFICSEERKIYTIGDDVTIPACTVNGEPMETSYETSDTLEGIYTIVYTYQVNDSITYTHREYFFMYGEFNADLYYVDPKRSEYL
jgi:M6 family metalloprotease-like protein